MVRKLLIVATIVLALSLASMFLPARQMNIEGIGRLSFETKITLSVGSEVAYASPDDTGWGNPSRREANSNWSWPQRMYTSDDRHAITSAWGEDAATVILHRFNFSGITGVIDGIEVGIEARYSASSGEPPVHMVRARLMWNGQASETSYKETPNVTTTDTYYTLGGLTDTWGRTWSADDFSNDNFAVRVSSNLEGDSAILPSLEVDHVQVRVYYTPPPTDISNTPSEINFGFVAENSPYWSNGTEPRFPLGDGECLFTLTNNSSGAVNISIKATNFSGGVGWTLAGSPGLNIVTLKAGRSGDANEGKMVTLTTGDQSFISSMGVSISKKWEIKLDTGTFTDGLQKSSTITLTAISA